LFLGGAPLKRTGHSNQPGVRDWGMMTKLNMGGGIPPHTISRKGGKEGKILRFRNLGRATRGGG